MSCYRCFIRSVCSVLLVAAVHLGCKAQQGAVHRISTRQLAQLIGQLHEPAILNFWATWCGPCVEELPLIQRIAKSHRADSLKVILISLDYADAYPNQIRRFIRVHHLVTPVFWLDLKDPRALARLVDPAWRGMIPLTLMLDPVHRYRRVYEQEMTPREWEERTSELLHSAGKP